MVVIVVDDEVKPEFVTAPAYSTDSDPPFVLATEFEIVLLLNANADESTVDVYANATLPPFPDDMQFVNVPCDTVAAELATGPAVT
jgi:hypothetical protein